MLDFHPALSGIDSIVNAMWPVLQSSEDMKRAFLEKPIIAYKRPRNLKDLIVRSKLKFEGEGETGMRKCRHQRCQI